MPDNHQLNWWEEIFMPGISGKVVPGVLNNGINRYINPNAIKPNIPAPQVVEPSLPRYLGSADTIERRLMGDNYVNPSSYNPPPVRTGTSSAAPEDYSALDALFSNLQMNTDQTGLADRALYDAALAKITGNYEEGSKDRFQQYTDSRDILTGQANNLGVDYDSSQMGKNYDLDLRRLQETSDENLNIDKSWIEKIKTLDADNINAIKLGLQQELAQRKLAQAAAHALARRGGGGGGSKTSNSTKDNVTETMTLENADYLPLLKELQKSAPGAATLFDSLYKSNNSNPDTAVSVGIAKQSALPKLAPYNPARFHPYQQAGNKQKAIQKRNFDLALAALGILTGKQGTPNTKITTTQKSSN